MLFSGIALGNELQVSTTDNLQTIINNSASGDTLVLQDGIFYGHFFIPHSLSITSQSSKTIIDAQGKGSVFIIKSSHVSISNLKIINWGSDLTAQDSAISTESHLEDITISNNELKGDGFGLWLQNGTDFVITDNKISGNPTFRLADRGNGRQISVMEDTLIKNNKIEHTRDGVYTISSKNNTIEKNEMSHLRFGIHYMYSDHNAVFDNVAHDVHVGYALMSSRNLLINNNHSFNTENHGILMNFINYSTITNNTVDHSWTPKENRVSGQQAKGLFIYNSSFNEITGNTIKNSEIGIHLTAESNDNKISGNNFINNSTQVKYISTRSQEWSYEGKGNYWSNYIGWDLNHNNKGDTPYEPNDGVDKIVWQYPESKLLFNSPAILMLRFVQRQFPVLKPKGVKDSFPLMKANKAI